jgi:hypothetical protein
VDNWYSRPGQHSPKGGGGEMSGKINRLKLKNLFSALKNFKLFNQIKGKLNNVIFKSS